MNPKTLHTLRSLAWEQRHPWRTLARALPLWAWLGLNMATCVFIAYQAFA